MKFFSLHKTTFFVATHTGDQLNFIATQPKSYDFSPPPTQAINDDNDWQHILNNILTHIQFNLTNSNLNRKCSKGHVNLDLPRNHVYLLRWNLIFNYMFVS